MEKQLHEMQMMHGNKGGKKESKDENESAKDKKRLNIMADSSSGKTLPLNLFLIC